jgi:large subunit ribosomal protein L21
MKAVIETGGKQYYVENNSEIYVEKLKNNAGEDVVFDKVLMINGVIGRPYLRNARVIGKVIKHGKQKKIIIFKYRPKKSSHSKQGHRQPYTKVQITKIESL